MTQRAHRCQATNATYLVGLERDLAAAARAGPDAAVVALVPDAIRELGLVADLTDGALVGAATDAAAARVLPARGRRLCLALLCQLLNRLLVRRVVILQVAGKYQCEK